MVYESRRLLFVFHWRCFGTPFLSLLSLFLYLCVMSHAALILLVQHSSYMWPSIETLFKCSGSRVKYWILHGISNCNLNEPLKCLRKLLFIVSASAYLNMFASRQIPIYALWCFHFIIVIYLKKKNSFRMQNIGACIQRVGYS